MSDLSRFSAVVAAPFGALGIVCDAHAVQELIYLPPSFQTRPPVNALAQRAAQQVTAYLQDAQAPFDLPLAPRGTLFQQKVWQAICAIPAGHVQTYGQIARALQSAPRAVGQACGANWFPLVVPCHRVTAAQGLGGFAHATDDFHLGVKRWLLQHEGALLL
ncbi:methylated-DNA--[protein]-cysteine S-methyltransferase [Massilia sp. W12]|uniref:methylated-DNA--[protein]-cysteine S-methyltransferase n=1 Tax=Massilia sp. W12 TaxID=3126507 RepID=UPI0030CEA01F